MSLVIGPITLEGDATQNSAMRPFVQSAVTLLGNRIKPLSIRVKARVDMPRYRDPLPKDKKPEDGHAEGYWKGGPRRTLIADDVFAPGRTDLDETIGHELIHVLFDDWFTPEQKAQLLTFLLPEPEGYSDTMVNGKDKGYPALAEECIAVWGSAALFGFAKPAYTTLYKRRIDGVNFPSVKTVMLGLKDTELQQCLANVAQLTTAMQAVQRERDVLLGRIAAKDNAMKDGLAL